ncbi:MAG: nucleoside kinase [Defluviitaleaceae bacterium]|nr:nucleoside kinase [Defluviitaleaceae bacterium]
MITIKLGNNQIQAQPGTKILDLMPDAMERGVLGCVCNNALTELTDAVYEDCEIKPIDINGRQGHMIYQRSAALLMMYAAKNVFGAKADVDVRHSVNKNLSCAISGLDAGTDMQTITEKIESAMLRAVEDDLPIVREVMSIRRARAILSVSGDEVTLNTLRYRRAGFVSMYKMGDDWACLYGPVVPSAGYLRDFKLIPERNGFILRLPNPVSAKPLSDVTSLIKIRGVYEESSAWSKVMGVEYVGALNNAICNRQGGNIIRVNEALHEKRIAAIADTIHAQGKHIVLIAGPSSSGKTTFAHRLAVQIRVLGLEPHVISLDNYFNDAKDVPLDELGKPDFENFKHVNCEQLNIDLVRLLKGETVELPTYNFQRGIREYRGDTLKLGSKGVLILEGIHALNEALVYQVPSVEMFKVFISAMTQINLDRHNRIPTSDTRLLRRIVRDMRTRATDAVRTMAMWENVARGEEKNIFPWQENADVMFNSALVYEMCVMKQYVEPLLFNIADDDPSKPDAVRLLGYLDSFVSLPPDEVPKGSILREFIGGSIYYS